MSDLSTILTSDGASINIATKKVSQMSDYSGTSDQAYLLISKSNTGSYRLSISNLVNDFVKSSVTPDLSGYVKTSDLTGYVKAGDLTAYEKTADLNNLLASYVKTSDLSDYAKTSDLTPYTKTATLNTILASYVKTSDLTDYVKSSDLSDYAKTSSLSIYAKTSDLSDYVKTSDLSDYAKTSSLSIYAKTSDLSEYVKTSDLSDYVKTSDLQTKVSDAISADINDENSALNTKYVDGDELAEALADCATSDAVETLTNEYNTLAAKVTAIMTTLKMGWDTDNNTPVSTDNTDSIDTIQEISNFLQNYNNTQTLQDSDLTYEEVTQKN